MFVGILIQGREGKRGSRLRCPSLMCGPSYAREQQKHGFSHGMDAETAPDSRCVGGSERGHRCPGPVLVAPTLPDEVPERRRITRPLGDRCQFDRHGKPGRSVSVGAFTSGPIAEVYVDFNSAVEKGGLLARIDPKLLAAAVARDRAALETQKAELLRINALLQQAKNNEDRGRKLLAINKDYLSDTDMDQYHYTRLSFEAQVKLAEASIKQAEANLKNSEVNHGYTEIRSPEAGIVIERKVDPGQTVAASFQTPELFIIAPDMDKHMYVYASVDEADIGLIRTAQLRGQAVKFTVDAYPGDLFHGQVHQIRKNSTTTQNVVTYPVIIEAANPDLKLMPGMTANISFQIEAKENVRRVPAAALRFIPLPAQVRPEDRHHVEVLPNGTAEGAVKRSAGDKAEKVRKRHH